MTKLTFTTLSGSTVPITNASTGWYSWDLSPIDGSIISTEIPYKKSKLSEGVELMILYDVYMIYAEKHNKLHTWLETGVLAADEEGAKIKSGLMKKIEDDWDTDYLTFVVKVIGQVKVRAKPKEVKTV